VRNTPTDQAAASCSSAASLWMVKVGSPSGWRSVWVLRRVMHHYATTETNGQRSAYSFHLGCRTRTVRPSPLSDE
jgi:hypothetical protein